MTETTLASADERLLQVRERIARAATLAGRDPQVIELIAVSKSIPKEAVIPFIEAGQRSFGESRVQEAEAKWAGLAPDSRRLHLVGRLQSNKALAAVFLFDVIHSVDRPSLIDALAQAIEESGRKPDCFIQVNIGEEPQKGGCAIAELPTLISRARTAGLQVMGLMCVPPAGLEPAPYFSLTAKLAKEHGLGELSMGMSADFETAVMLGATCVRVGSSMFGERF